MKTLFISLLLCICCNVYSSGYMFEASSTNAISTAINNGVEGTDPSVIAQNPAAITYLDGTQISTSIITLFPKIKYYNAKGYYFLTHEPIQGETSNKNISSTAYTPSFFLSHQLNYKYFIGLGIYPSMAAKVDYNMNSVLRYNINQTFLMSININPILAFKLNDNNSLSIGIIAQYTKAKLREFADFNGGINYQIPVIGKFIGENAIQIIPRKTDGYAQIRGMGTSYGFNLGWIWNIQDDLRFGLSYISKIKHTLHGSGTWDFYGEAFDLPILGKFLRDGIRENGYVATEGGMVKFTSPDIFNIHLLHKLTDKLNLMIHATWTHHSLFNELKINFENSKTVPNGKTGVTDDKSSYSLLKPLWKNTWKFGAGLTYQLNNKLQLRAGVTFDKSPVSSPSSRFNTLPDSDRIALGIGTNYLINKNNSISLGYLYVKAKKTHSEVNGWCGGDETSLTSQNCVSSRTYSRADFKSQAHLIGFQYNYKF